MRKRSTTIPLFYTRRTWFAATWFAAICIFGLSVSTLASASGHTAAAHQNKPGSSSTLALTHAEYLDRVQAIWTAQMIGQMTGVRFEHGQASALPLTPLTHLPGYAPVDDDYYYEMVAIRAFEKYGIGLTVEQLGQQWLGEQCGFLGIE